MHGAREKIVVSFVRQADSGPDKMVVATRLYTGTRGACQREVSEKEG